MASGSSLAAAIARPTHTTTTNGCSTAGAGTRAAAVSTPTDISETSETNTQAKTASRRDMRVLPYPVRTQTKTRHRGDVRRRVLSLTEWTATSEWSPDASAPR